MSEETWDRVLGDLFAALDRDAAAEGQLIAIAPQLSDEQILRAWAYLAHDDALRWRARSALAHEALQRVVGRAECDGRGTAAVRQLAAELGIEPGRVYRLAQIHGVIEGGTRMPLALSASTRRCRRQLCATCCCPLQDMQKPP